MMPSQLVALTPGWKSCNGGPATGLEYLGIINPPRALIPTAAMRPSPTQISDLSLSAAPASTPYHLWLQ